MSWDVKSLIAAGVSLATSIFVKLTDGTDILDLLRADADPTIATILVPTKPVDLHGNVIPGGGLASSGAGNGGSWSSAEGDFTAVYLGADTLTLGTFPAAIGTPVSGQFVAVTMTDAAGLRTQYLAEANAMTLAAQVLTVAGAAFVPMGGVVAYNVVLLAVPKGYASAENAHDGRDISPAYKHLDPRVVCDVTNGPDVVVPYYIDVETYKYGTLQIDLGCTAGTVTLTVESANAVEGEAASAADYDDTMMLEEFGISSIVAAAGIKKDSLKFDRPFAWKYIKVEIAYATGATTGDAKVTWIGKV